MISKLTRLRLLAVLCGPLLGVAAAFVSSLAMGITLRLMPGTDAAVWEPVSYGVAWIPLAALVTALAAFFGAYDLLIIVSCVVPALLFFGVTYAMNVSSYLPNNGGFYDIAGGIPPFDYTDQLALLLKALTLTVGTAAMAIVLKRVLRAKAQQPAPASSAKLWRCVAFDLGFLLLVLAVTLGLDLQSQLRLGEPSVITANVTQVLDSPTSTPADREGALFHMQEFSDKFRADDISSAVTKLKTEVQLQPTPVNLVVAEALITFHDYSALPLIEDALERSSQPGAVAPPGGWGYLASYLDRIKDPAALPVLIRLFDSPDGDIRYGAIQGIRNFQSPEVIPILIKGLDDPDPRVKQSSEWGLGLYLGGDEHKYGWRPPRYDSQATEHQAYVGSLKAWAKAWQEKSSLP